MRLRVDCQVRVASAGARLLRRLARARRLRLLLLVPAARVVAALLFRGWLDLTCCGTRTNLTIIQAYIILVMCEVLILRPQLVYLRLQLQLVLLLG